MRDVPLMRWEWPALLVLSSEVAFFRISRVAEISDSLRVAEISDWVTMQWEFLCVVLSESGDSAI